MTDPVRILAAFDAKAGVLVEVRDDDYSRLADALCPGIDARTLEGVRLRAIAFEALREIIELRIRAHTARRSWSGGGEAAKTDIEALIREAARECAAPRALRVHIEWGVAQDGEIARVQ